MTHHTIVDDIPVKGCKCSTCAQVVDMLASPLPRPITEPDPREE